MASWNSFGNSCFCWSVGLTIEGGRMEIQDNSSSRMEHYSRIVLQLIRSWIPRSRPSTIASASRSCKQTWRTVHTPRDPSPLFFRRHAPHLSKLLVFLPCTRTVVKFIISCSKADCIRGTLSLFIPVPVHCSPHRLPRGSIIGDDWLTKGAGIVSSPVARRFILSLLGCVFELRCHCSPADFMRQLRLRVCKAERKKHVDPSGSYKVVGVDTSFPRLNGFIDVLIITHCAPANCQWTELRGRRFSARSTCVAIMQELRCDIVVWYVSNRQSIRMKFNMR